MPSKCILFLLVIIFPHHRTKRKSKWDTPTNSMPGSLHGYPGDPTQSASSLEAASAAAAKINAMLIAKGKLKLPQASNVTTASVGSTSMNKPKVGIQASYS